MNDQTSYQSAIEEYRRLLDEATVKSKSIELDRGGPQIFAVDKMEERAPQMELQSTSVRQALEQQMAEGSPSARELASLQLLSATAMDLTVSYSLLEGERPAAARGVHSVIKPPGLDELQQLLRLNTAAGMEQLPRMGARAVLPTKPGAARTELESVLATYTQAIPQNTAEVGKGVVDSVVKLGLGPANTVAVLAGQEILALLPVSVTGIVASAAGMLVEAVKKVRAALGPDHEQEIANEAGGWLQELGGTSGVILRLLDRLYETSRINKEAREAIAAASKPRLLAAEKYNKANTALMTLLDRSNQTAATMGKVLRVMGFVQPVLLGAVPWGPVGLYSAYAGMLGFAVYSGGDYLDWHRVEWDWADRVKGMREVLQQSLVRDPAAPAPAPAANPV